MTYVVTEACIKCKYTDCVTYCPADCFYEGENMLVINPEECIDCGVCVEDCPVNAIVPDTVEGAETWVAFNQTYAQQWPRLTVRIAPPPDADAWAEKSDKMPFFSEKPGGGSPS